MERKVRKSLTKLLASFLVVSTGTQAGQTPRTTAILRNNRKECALGEPTMGNEKDQNQENTEQTGNRPTSSNDSESVNKSSILIGAGGDSVSHRGELVYLREIHKKQGHPTSTA